MPALKPTEFTGTIVWLGRVASRKSTLRSESVDRLEVGFDGPEGEAHGGLNRVSCSRVLAQYPRGTEIRNVRQMSIVSAEELAGICEKMGMRALGPELLGASMVIKGIPDFTHVPPSSRLQSHLGTTLVVDMENRSCALPSKEIDFETPGRGQAFMAAAKGRRGVTAWVERPGVLRVGDQVRVHVPDQRIWSHQSSARR
jgi:hypothetical protein